MRLCSEEPTHSPVLSRSGSAQASAGAGSAAGAVGPAYPLHEDAERPEEGEPYYASTRIFVLLLLWSSPTRSTKRCSLIDDI